MFPCGQTCLQFQVKNYGFALSLSLAKDSYDEPLFAGPWNDEFTLGMGGTTCCELGGRAGGLGGQAGA